MRVDRVAAQVVAWAGRGAAATAVGREEPAGVVRGMVVGPAELVALEVLAGPGPAYR